MHKQLLAFYPEYTSQGSITRLMYVDEISGTECHGQDPRQVESVKRNLAGCYAVDLRAQGKLLRSNYGRQRVLHFYLPDGRVFVPFKLRQSRITGDACYGYVDLEQVARLLPGRHPSIILHSGTSLKLYSSISSARLSYFLGLEIMSDFARTAGNDNPDLINALEILRQVLAGQTQVNLPVNNRRSLGKFLPIT